MEELFRFSVIRAATRSNAATVSLERPPAPPPAPTPAPSVPVQAVARAATVRPVVSSSLPTFITSNLGSTAGTSAATQPPKSFQDQLRETVQSLSGQSVDPEAIWKRLEPIALEFVLSQAHIILTNSLWMDLQSLADSLQQALANRTVVPNLSATFSSSLVVQKGQAPLPGYQLDLADLFIALLIIRRGGPANLDAIIRSRKLWEAAELLSDNPTLEEIADGIRIIDLIKAGPGALAPPPDAKTPTDIQAAVQTAFEAAMNKTLLFPPAIFAVLQKPVHGVGFRELHVVKQHIRRYELAEVGRIENILKGESRDHSQKHTLSNERDTFLSTETTTETDKELTSTDHVDIKNETQNQVKEDTKVDGGVHAQYDGGSFHLQADVTVSYDKSTDDTKKFSSDVAKDVTQKAVNKVTQQVTQSQTTKIIETFEETEDQVFDNKNGQGHVSGVYQWVEKVYLAQVFNLGRHLLLDIMVPEPGASLLAAAATPAPNEAIPIQPDPLGDFIIDSNGKKQLTAPLKPDQLTDTTAANFWIGKYQATGVEPPPGPVTVVKTIESQENGQKDNYVADMLKIDDGYSALTADISISFRPRDPGTSGGDKAGTALTVQLGSRQLMFGWDTSGWDPLPAGAIVFQTQKVGDYNRVGRALGQLLNNETAQLSININTIHIHDVAVNVEVLCTPTQAKMDEWRLRTYDKIATAWQKLQSDYESKLAALQFQKATIGPLGAADPETNRLTERIELKRACVAILDNANETVRGVEHIAIQDSPSPILPAPPNPPNTPDPVYQPILPEPILPVTQQLGANVRWFEQAFEWENMAYVSYPYFWGRRQTWIERLNLKNDDPLFLKFLQAGYARVLVPVRLGFEWAVHFYLHTGLPWLGGGLPPIGDKTQNPLYLDIAEEIKALTGGGESEETDTPIGEPWEYILPTTLVKVRTKDDALPEWSRVGLDGKPAPTNFPSDQPDGPWTWVDGPPGSQK